MAERVGVGIGVVLWRHSGAGKELLVGLRKGKHGGGTWALPGGWLEHGEDFVHCALRELREETGIEAAAVSEARLSEAPPTNNIMRDEGKHSVTVFVEADLAAPEVEARVMEPDKCAGWEWVRPEGVPDPKFPSLAKLLAWLEIRR